MTTRKNKILRIENGVVWMDVSTRKWPGVVTQFDEADLALVTSGGRWCAAEKNGGFLYVIRPVPGGNKQEWLHKLLLGSDTVLKGDHINGDRLDNRRDNLRPATQNQNTKNQRKRRNTKNRFKGVTWREDKGAWRARIKVNYKEIFLGHFSSEEDAARAYDSAAVRYFGEFANINLPREFAA